MCFRRSPSDKPTPAAPPPRSPCVLATRLPVWWDDVYNNGERQSNFTQHARQGSHLSARPPRHIWKEMRLKTTLTSCTGRCAKGGGRVGGRGVPHTGVRYNFTLAGRLSKWRNITLCCVASLSYFLPLFTRISHRRGCRSHAQVQWNPHAEDSMDFFASPHHTWYGTKRIGWYHLTPPPVWCMSFHRRIVNTSKFIWPNQKIYINNEERLKN